MQLSDFQTSQGHISIAPFDHRASLAQSMRLNLQSYSDQEKFLQLKRLFMAVLSPHVSAVLTDPEYGVKTLGEKSGSCGVFLSLEESGYSGDHDAMTTLRPYWGIDGVKEHHAGAKLLVYYNPASATASAKIELVRRLFVECKDKGVVFLVEPVLYDLPGQKLWETEMDSRWSGTHLEVCRSFAPFCDILKIQYPGSEIACREVSAMHPHWVLLSRGVDFATFSQYLTVALRYGCSGYAAGRAVWQELTELNTPEEWRHFLQTTAVPRLMQLNALLYASRLSG